MSMYINFEAYDWLMGFAIEKAPEEWRAYTDDGNTYRIITLKDSTLGGLKQQIRAYHKGTGNWYDQQIEAGLSDEEIQELELLEE